jgi:hypothetical protein
MKIENAHTVPGGERFCPDCYSEHMRRKYYEQ